MKQTTLCLLMDDKRILLAMKKRGFGAGLWNGCGGKIQPGESTVAAALREMHEEIGVTADEKDLIPAGHLFFYFSGKRSNALFGTDLDNR